MGNPRTIRICGYVFKVRCPRTWGQPAMTDDPAVRRCEGGARDVPSCTTDAETIRHARLGRCVARAMPPGEPTGTMMVGAVAEDERLPEVDLPAGCALQQEKDLDAALQALGTARRTCSTCTFPIPDGATACVVCR